MEAAGCGDSEYAALRKHALGHTNVNHDDKSNQQTPECIAVEEVRV